MPATLYLDTARLGQMSPTALKTHCDFVRLMAEDPSSLYTENFLFGGATAAPDIPQRFPELARWPGIERFKQQLRAVFAASAGSETEVLLSGRTTNLMKLGTESQRGCRRFLITDLTWPPYHRWIQRYAARSGLTLHVLPLKRPVLDGVTADDIVEMTQTAIHTSGADCLFLPAISHTGIRLPLQQILHLLATSSRDIRTVIDASQAYGHIDTSSWSHLADFVFGGCHKWLRAYLPLGVGFARGLTSRQLRRTQSRDPLMDFCRSTATSSAGPMETVNLSPLFAARGAIHDSQHQKRHPLRFRDVEPIRRIIREQPHWQSIETHNSLRSLMLLVRTRRDSLRRLSSQTMRAMFGRAGISVTAYPGGHLRLSMPVTGMRRDEFDRLESALRLLQ
ncbi:MAG: aminotransferase class V-fold PLP-dependent enzyme [Planctomycetaceae bacterium]